MAKTDLTAARLREILDYNPETGIFTWRSRVNRYATLVDVGGVAGAKRCDGYWMIYINRIGYRAHRLAWMYVYGHTPEFIDHINGVRSDNRIANLRPASRSLNNQNRTKAKGKHLPLGVKQDKRKYVAHITVTLVGKKINLYLGSFESASDAEAVYAAAKDLMHPGALSGRPAVN